MGRTAKLHAKRQVALRTRILAACLAVMYGTIRVLSRAVTKTLFRRANCREREKSWDDNSRRSGMTDCAFFTTASRSQRSESDGGVPICRHIHATSDVNSIGASIMIAGRPFFGFKRMPISRGLCGAILAGVLIGGSCWLSAADDSPGTGLRGVLPQTIPSDLTAAIESLPDNWKPWGAAVSADLATLYEKEGVDSAEQRKAIGALRRRMASINTYVGDPRYRSLLNPLVTLWGGLKRRLDTAEAALDTLEQIGRAHV